MIRSFANGNGASVANSPGNPYRTADLQGFDIRPATSWDPYFRDYR